MLDKGRFRPKRRQGNSVVELKTHRRKYKRKVEESSSLSLRSCLLLLFMQPHLRCTALTMITAAEVIPLLLTLLSPALQGLPLCPSRSAMTDTSITTSGTLTFCNLPCKAGGEYNVDHHNSMVFSFFCEDKSLRVYGGYKNRTTVDTACGCVIVTDISSHDDGTYFIYHFKEESRSLLHMVDYHYMAPIIISNISITRLGENSSLTVHYTGDEPATVIWSKKGGDLPEGHRLTDHSKTLTIPGNVTGVYRVVVYNSASTDSREYGTSEGDPSDAGIICAIVFPLLLIIVLIVIWVMIRRKKYTGGAKIQYNPAPLQR